MPLLRSSLRVTGVLPLEARARPSRLSSPFGGLRASGRQRKALWLAISAEGWALWVHGRWLGLLYKLTGVPASWGSDSFAEPSGRASSWGS